MVENWGWDQLGDAVDAGELYLERGVARQCATRCAAFVEQLVTMREDAYTLGRVEGFGPLPSGLALKAKFEAKAVGGDYSLVQALTDQIDEVQRMQAVFEKIEAQYAATDADTAVAFEGVDGGR